MTFEEILNEARAARDALENICASACVPRQPYKLALASLRHVVEFLEAVRGVDQTCSAEPPLSMGRRPLLRAFGCILPMGHEGKHTVAGIEWAEGER